MPASLRMAVASWRGWRAASSSRHDGIDPPGVEHAGHDRETVAFDLQEKVFLVAGRHCHGFARHSLKPRASPWYSLPCFLRLFQVKGIDDVSGRDTLDDDRGIAGPTGLWRGTLADPRAITGKP